MIRPSGTSNPRRFAPTRCDFRCQTKELTGRVSTGPVFENRPSAGTKMVQNVILLRQYIITKRFLPEKYALRAHTPPQHRIYHAFSSILDGFLGKYDDFEISKSKMYFFGEKKNHSDQKSLKIDKATSLDTPRYRVYCLTPPELEDPDLKKVLFFSGLVTATRWTFNFRKVPKTIFAPLWAGPSGKTG